MSTKYYLAHNAGSRVIGGEKFEITEIVAGTAIGVFATEDPKTIEAIDKVVGKTGVEEITVKEYDAAIKKKPPSFNSFPHSNTQSPQVRLSPVAGVVVEGGVTEDTTEADKLESVEAAVSNLGRVEPPPVVDEAPKTLSDNQKRRNK